MMENKKKKHLKRRKVFVPPTAEELSKFREVQFLHHSNIFRMEMEEMLAALQIKQKTKVKVNSWLADFRTYLKSLGSSKPFQLNNTSWIEEEDLRLPSKSFSKLPPYNGYFRFIPPKELTLVGSFPLDLATTHSKVVDVALLLPKDCMQKNDFSNGKWLLRRVLYLSWIGKALKSNTDLVSSVAWAHHCGSPLRPTLQVTASGKLGNNWKFNLLPIPPEDFYKFSRVSPTKSNVHPTWYFRREKIQGEPDSPTPHHNWLCGVDLMMINHHSFIADHLKHPNWVQGVILLKIWMSQRNLNQGEGCLSTHMMTLYVIELVKMRKISPQMSPYQVFRTALLYLSQSDWLTEGPSLCRDEVASDRNEALPTLEEFQELYPVVFVDPTGFFNLAGNVQPQGYLELKHEAKIGLEILELSSANSFDALFIQKGEFHLTFDQTLQIILNSKTLTNIFKKNENDPDRLIADRLGDFRVHVINRVVSSISQGLEDRVDLIGVDRGRTVTWGYDAETPTFDSVKLTLGFLVNPRTSVALLTKGPSADSAEAEEFRKFWGDLCGLRRFRDSTFHEAVLWMDQGEAIGDRRLIVGKIVADVMQRHFGVPETEITYVAGQLESVLRMPYTYKDDETFRYGTGEEVNSSAILAFDALSKKLRSLDLPLNISSIQSTCEILRHSAVYPPVSQKMQLPVYKRNYETDWQYFSVPPGRDGHSPLYRPVIEVQLFLEISGKWPDDLLAIKAIKLEFLIKIAELLRKDGLTVVVLPTHLQLSWNGYVFSITICYRKEMQLLRQTIGGGGEIVEEEDAEESIELEKEIEILPKLTASLNSLQSDFPSFSGALRLIRRWVSAQLFIPHFPLTVIELLVAHLFLNSNPHSPPNTPHVALLRFWNLVVKVDWKSTPILVNLRKEFSAEDENELTKHFTANRSHLPPLFICTPCELRLLPNPAAPTPEDLKKRYKLASCWSKSGPLLPILARMKTVAQAALQTYSANMWKRTFDFTILFKPPLNDYDVLIFLNEDEIARRLERVGRKQEVSIRRYQHTRGEKLPPVAFDPVQCYIKELRDSYGNHALFFNDEHGGSVIGVVWKPHAAEEKEAKLSNFDGHKLIGVNEIRQIVDLESAVENFQILGEGLVQSVKLKSE